jgi:hypothetical protein
MDFKMKADINPDSIVVNKTKMRCLVKCLGMFGLGHYIYAGEDLPQESDGAKSAAKPSADTGEHRKIPAPTEAYKRAFESVTSLDGLKSLWEGLTKEEREICAELKETAKGSLK